MNYYSTSNSAYGAWNQNNSYGQYNQPSSGYGNYSQNQFDVTRTGLINVGNSCYMNSILQALFDVLILSTKYPQQQPITYLYSKLQQTHNNNDYIEFKKYLGSKLQITLGNQQQDAHQFMAGLLQILNRENQQSTSHSKPNFAINKKKNQNMNWGYFCDQMRKTDDSKIIDIFGGEFYTQTRCPSNHSDYFFERFLHISIPIQTDYYNIYHLQRLLKQNFKQQTVEDAMCQSCKYKTRKNKRSLIYNPPKVLILQLKRFAQGFWSNSKIDTRIAYNQILQLTGDYCHPDTLTLNSIYHLYAVVHHIGSLNGGHYYTQKKVANQWYQFNDLVVNPIAVQPQDNVSETAYMFFFKLKD